MFRPNHLSPFHFVLRGQRDHYQGTEKFIRVSGALELIQQDRVKAFKVEGI